MGIIVIVLLVANVSYSQQQLIGLKAGPALTMIQADRFGDTNMRISLTAGFTYDYLITDNLSLNAEMLYSARGFRNDFYLTNDQGDFLGTKTIRWNYDYLSIPLKISYSGRGKIYGFVSGGIVPAFLVSAKTKFPKVGDFDAVTTDVKDASTFDLAGVWEAGGGYRFSDHCRMFTSLSVQYSFTAFTNSNYFEGGDGHHYGFALTAGVKYAPD